MGSPEEHEAEAEVKGELETISGGCRDIGV